MSTASINQQWMLNEFKDYEIKFNNQGDNCLISLTYKKGITLNAICLKTTTDKANTILFLVSELNEVIEND